MIIFQLTLSGQQLRTLVAVREHMMLLTPREVPDTFVTSIRALIREGLVTHESPCDCNKPTRWYEDEEYRKFNLPTRSGKRTHFHQPRRRYVYEITPKGELALQMAALDLKDFLDEVQGELQPAKQQRRIPSG